jgi:hypothetical protein
VHRRQRTNKQRCPLKPPPTTPCTRIW